MTSSLLDNTCFLALDLLEGDFSEHYQHYGYYTGHDFIELAKRLEIPEKPIKKFIVKIQSKKSDLLELIKHSYMPDGMKAKANALIEARLKALLAGVDDKQA